MRKALSVALLLVLLCSMSAVAEEAAGTVDYAAWGANLPFVPEGETVTLKIAVPQSADNYDWDQVWFWKWASEAMNIHFEVEQIPDASVDQRVNLMFASGEVPDILFGIGLSTANLVKYGQYEQQLLPINAYITEELTPNLYAWSQEESFENCICPDGNQYVFPYIDRLVFNSGNGHPIYVNKEWMDELGYEMPTTVEELTELLRAFKADDPDCIPMGGSAMGISYVMTHLQNAYGLQTISGDNYGIQPSLRRSQDLVVPCATPEYKEYLTTMHTWYAEGLISPDFFTMDRVTDMAQAAEGKYGAWAYPYDQANPDLEAVQKWYAMPSLLSTTNDVYSVPRSSASVRPGNAVISADTEYPELCMKFMDFFYSPLGTIYGWYGPMAGTADTLDMVGGWYADENGDIQYVDVDNGKFSSGYQYSIGCVAPCSTARMNNRCELGWDSSVYSTTALLQHFAGLEPQPEKRDPNIASQFPHYTLYTYDTLHLAEDQFNTQYVYFDEETAIQVQDLQTVIRNYVTTETAKFITGARSLDEFDAYLEELEAIGVDEYLQYYKDVTGR